MSTPDDLPARATDADPPEGTGAPVITDRFVHVGDVRFWLRRADPPEGTAATGTPVLLLHGVPETSLAWRHLLPILATDRTVLAPDLPGLGGSGPSRSYAARDIAAALAGLVHAELDPRSAAVGLLATPDPLAPGSAGAGVEDAAVDAPSDTADIDASGPPAAPTRVDVVGHDWGGALAIALAGFEPGLVRRLVVISAPYRHLDVLHAPHIPFFALPVAPEVLFRVGGRRLVDVMFASAWRSGAMEPEVRSAYRSAYRDPAKVSAMLGYYRALVRGRLASAIGRAPARATVDVAAPTSDVASSGPAGSSATPSPSGTTATQPAAGAATQPAAGAPAAAPRRSHRPHPDRTLVVWGARDPVMPARLAQGVADDLGGGTVITVPEVGHWPHEENPAAVDDEVVAFLRSPL